MIGVATFATPPSFLGVGRNDPAAPICVAGIPFDIGTTNRAGTRFGPAAIRQASRMLIDGDHPTLWVDPAKLPLADIGNFAIALGDIAKSAALIEEQAARIAHLVALGGDHGITRRSSPPHSGCMSLGSASCVAVITSASSRSAVCTAVSRSANCSRRPPVETCSSSAGCDRRSRVLISATIRCGRDDPVAPGRSPRSVRSRSS